MGKNVCYLLVPITDIPVYDSDGTLIGVTGLTPQAFAKFKKSEPEWAPGWWMPGTREFNGRRPVQLLMTRNTDLDVMNKWLTDHNITWTVGLLHKDRATLKRRENGSLVLKGGEPQMVLRNWKRMGAAFIKWMADKPDGSRPTQVDQFHSWLGYAPVGETALAEVVDDTVPDDTPDE